MMRQPAARAVVATAGLVALLLPAPAAAGPAPVVSRAALLRAEASRAATPGELDTLLAGLASPSPLLQRQAVRALGRLERPELTPRILPLLAARAPRVRAEAANAAAQAAGQDPVQATSARREMLNRLRVEGDPDARGALCAALGRLPVDQPAELEEITAALLAATWARSSPPGAAGRLDASEVILEGALRGLESVTRLRSKIAIPAPAVVERLRALAARRPPSPPRRPAGSGAPDDAPALALRVRRLAMLALNAVPGGPDAATLQSASTDPDDQVRRLAAASPGRSSGDLARAMTDRAAMVRYEALRAWGRRFQAAEGCAAAVRAAGDANGHVALLAIDLLGNCPADPVAIDALATLTAATSWAGAGGGQRWQRPAHALVSLARTAPERARAELVRALKAEAWQSRMYAAQAAGVVADVPALRALAGDAHACVREAALSGLSRTSGHEADPLYLAALEATDNQLVMTAARALAGTPDSASAVPALLAALARFTATGSDTSRDPRLAILERVRQLGSRAQAPALARYLADPDPRVASLAATTLTEWTGERHAAAPAPPLAATLPDEKELARLEGATMRVRMQDLGVFEARLLVAEAPLTCAHIARLAAAGYYDNLTFHRVVPNFLIQGGSPGANEFVGHDRFMRDEVGRVSHYRGAMGVSTRGRDTGDAQIYVDIIDVPRLDHDYTVFAQVVRGMDVVDAVLEGAVIEKVEIVFSNGGRK